MCFLNLANQQISEHIPAQKYAFEAEILPVNMSNLDRTSNVLKAPMRGYMQNGFSTHQYVPAPWDVSSIPWDPTSSSTILLRPKSVTFATPTSSNRTFPGFRS